MIEALGRFKDAAAIKPLVAIAQERGGRCRAAAVDALVAIVKDKKRAGATRGEQRLFVPLLDRSGG